jgi:hypothetical protein
MIENSVFILGNVVEYKQTGKHDGLLKKYISLRPNGKTSEMTQKQKNVIYKSFKVNTVYKKLEDAQENAVKILAEKKLRNNGMLEGEWKLKGNRDSDGFCPASRPIFTIPIYKVSFEKEKPILGINMIKLNRIHEIWVTNLEGPIEVLTTDHPGLNEKRVKIDKDFL